MRESRQRAERRSKGHWAAGELPDGLGVMKHSLFAGAACVDDGKKVPQSLFDERKRTLYHSGRNLSSRFDFWMDEKQIVRKKSVL